MFRERNIFGAACSHIPIEFKILVALRILGRNNTADDTNELSGGSIGESTCVHIFKAFVTNMPTFLYDEWITEPVGEALKKIMEGYRLLGLPGAIRSMDVTHVWWARCPKDLIWSVQEKKIIQLLHSRLWSIIIVRFIT